MSYWAQNALFAYLDAGTGSLIVQAVIAFVLGVGVTMKIYWSQVRKWFTRSSAESDASDGDEA